MAQLVKRPALDFGSGNGLRVREIEPRGGLWTVSTESAWDSLSLPLSHLCAVSLSLKNKINFKEERNIIAYLRVVYFTACTFPPHPRKSNENFNSRT